MNSQLFILIGILLGTGLACIPTQNVEPTEPPFPCSTCSKIYDTLCQGYGLPSLSNYCLTAAEVQVNYVVGTTSEVTWPGTFCYAYLSCPAGTVDEYDAVPIDDTSCTPSSLAPFLFAYSNDLDAEDVRDTWRQMVSSNYASYSSVRFDLNNNYGIEVYWNETYESADAVVQRTLPDSSLGFPSSAYGSNILLAIKKYFTESSEPVCGSIIVVLLKRYPNEADYSQVVSLARQHHAVIHVISSVLPSGGTQSIVMYGVSSKTNGMCGFEFDSEFSTFINFLPLFLTPFPVYATNIKVSGNGTTHLPPLSVPDFDNYFIMMTLQDYGPLDSFRDLQLTWYNRQSSYSNSFDMTLSVALGRDTNGTCVNTWNYLDSVNYDMTLSYTYSDWKTESLQIRVYRGTPLPYWLPYSD